jgi:hypothetical protein
MAELIGVPMAQVHVFCARPGLIRGGRSNPRHAAHDVGTHSPGELRALLAEPEIVVVVGEVLTEAHIAAIEAEGKKAPMKKGG